MPFTCDAIIFDLDGVLVDSNAIAERHLRIWAERYEISFTRIAAVHHGRTTVETLRAVAPHLDAEREAALLASAEARDTDGLVAFAGASRLLAEVSRHRWAIATSCGIATASSRLEYLELPHPDVLVTAEDVTNGKPAPDAYVLAARQLAVDPSRCVVVEDAPAGIVSARAAGARVIGVASTLPESALVGADVIVRRLDDLHAGMASEALVISWHGAA